jgi:hypothetical protein
MTQRTARLVLAGAIVFGAAVRAPSRRRLVWCGALAGLTAAFRHQLGIAALALPVAVLV